MSLIEILILLAFVFFPLVQALLERARKRGEGEELPPPEADDDRPHPPVVLAKPPAPAQTPEEGWSSDWASWPSEEMEALSSREVFTEEQADELIRYQEQVAAREMPEAVRVAVPVVSMEPLDVDRGAEHRRLHERRLAPATGPARRSRPIAIGKALTRPSDLRKAVILAEVLGPPRALEPVD